MKSYLDNLRPFERRLVVGVGVLLFIVLNFAFVLPYFSDWAKYKARKATAEQTLKKFQDEIQQTNQLNRLIAGLESEGAGVPPEDQASEFTRTIQVLAAERGVNIINLQKMTEHTTQFFIVKSQGLQLAAKEDNLVDFLYELGNGRSLIRVGGLNIHPDVPQRQNLNVNVTLVASFQKKVTVRTTAPAPVKGAPPPAKPVTAASKSSAAAGPNAKATAK